MEVKNNTIEMKEVEEIRKQPEAYNKNNNELPNFPGSGDVGCEIGEAIDGEITGKQDVRDFDHEIESNISGSPSKSLDKTNNEMNQDEINCVNLDEPSTSTGLLKHKGFRRKPNILRRSTSKKKTESKPVENFLKGTDIDELLEKTAQKNQLSARNVRSIIHHVITNEHVLSMVRNTMNSEKDESETPEAFYQPKLTRSKFRQLTGVKDAEDDKTETSKLLVHEFPENESSDDDFEPVAENEEESDEDELNSSLAMSNFGSPVKTFLKAAERNECELYTGQSEDEARLVIEEPEKPEDTFEISFQSTNFEDDEDTISLRTRSKLPLDDTPLESIEAAFIAPDITVDMYDSYCDDEDWRSFLKDFTKPIANTEEIEDDINDPEYNFLEDNEMTDEWDLRTDRAVKVSKKELNELITELLEATQQDMEDEDEFDQSFDTAFPLLEDPLPIQVLEPSPNMETKEPATSPFLTPDMTAILEEQMRMHVQLLAQTYVLTYGCEDLRAYNESAKTLLNELNTFSKKDFADPNRKSAFAAHNLPGALNLIRSFESGEVKVAERIFYERPSKRKLIPKSMQDVISKDPVFIYPKLLPHCRMEPKNVCKPLFLPSEDTLLAYGLEQFTPIKDIDVIHEIKMNMLPVKTEGSLKKRIKNQKYKSDQNPVAYYFSFGHAPRKPITVPKFNPKQAIAPYYRVFRSDIMPEWLAPHIVVRKKAPPIVSMPPIPCLMEPKDLAMPRIYRRPYRSKKPPPKKITKPLLPLVKSPLKLRTSPLKQVSFILRKYGMRCSKNQARGLCFSSPIKCYDTTKFKRLLPKTPNLNKNLINFKSEKVPTKCIAKKTVKVNLDGTTSNLKDSIKVTDTFSSETCHPIEEGVTDVGSQSEIDTCEEEDEVVDNEIDLAALMRASSTICKKKSINIKKKKKHERELESTLPLLGNDLVLSDPHRDSRLTASCHAYIQKVKDTLTDDLETFEAFGSTLSDYRAKNKEPVELFHEISKIFQKYPSLVDDFVQFLSLEDAKECDRYEDYALFEKSQLFLRKLEVQFGNQPNQLHKLLKMFKFLQKQPNSDLSSDLVRSSLNPFLRSRSHILEELSLLMPEDAPPESMMTDFEEFQLPDSDSEMVDNDKDSQDDYEDFVLPETEDAYGTMDCPCNCHTESSDLRMQNRHRHCVSCGMRFIDGKIFLQTGKVLKPAQVIYHSKIKLSDDCEKSSEASSLINCMNKPESLISKEVANCAMVESDIQSNSSSNSTPTKDKIALGETSDPKWSKEEDALLLKTCQKLDASIDESEIAFEQVCQILKNRTLDSIKIRFKELLNLFLAEKSDDEMETDDDSIDIC